MLRPRIQIRNVRGIDEHREAIEDDLRTRINNWCEPNRNVPFCARDLVGGEHTYWDGTALYHLYERNVRRLGSRRANIQAGKDVGHLLAAVLNNDRRTFETSRRWVREYRLV